MPGDTLGKPQVATAQACTGVWSTGVLATVATCSVEQRISRHATFARGPSLDGTDGAGLAQADFTFRCMPLNARLTSFLEETIGWAAVDSQRSLPAITAVLRLACVAFASAAPRPAQKEGARSVDFLPASVARLANRLVFFCAPFAALDRLRRQVPDGGTAITTTGTRKP